MNLKFKDLVILALLGFLQAFSYSYGQEIIKNRDRINGKRFSYYVMEPGRKVNGIVILLPGWGEKPRSIFEKTHLPQLLAEKGYLTIVPELHQTLFADEYAIAELNQIFQAQSKKHNLSGPVLIVGGLSAGGAVAVGYAEYLLASNKNSNLKGVFAIDAPLDLARMYISAERKITYNCDDLIRKEGYRTKNYLDNALGGSPVSKPKKYLEISAFSAGASDGGRAKVLKSIPIRLYTEPDLDFVRKTYCQELQFTDINAIDAEKLSQLLKKLGNSQSEYISTEGRGFHSWNIVDATDCTDWIMKVSE